MKDGHFLVNSFTKSLVVRRVTTRPQILVVLTHFLVVGETRTLEFCYPVTVNMGKWPKIPNFIKQNFYTHAMSCKLDLILSKQIYGLQIFCFALTRRSMSRLNTVSLKVISGDNLDKDVQSWGQCHAIKNISDNQCTQFVNKLTTLIC